MSWLKFLSWLRKSCGGNENRCNATYKELFLAYYRVYLSHKEYDSDIALIKLKDNVDLQSYTPVCLPQTRVSESVASWHQGC